MVMHEGHRSRLVKKMVSEDKLYEHEKLEVLLFNSCPRRNVNDVAHRLLDKFKNIKGVLHASEEELTSVDGVGKNMAQYLMVIGKSLDLCHDVCGFDVLHCTEDLKNFMLTRPANGVEKLEFLMMDRDGRVRRIFTFTGKDGGRAEATYRQILRCVSLFANYGLFVAYCKPGGCAPCEEDDNLVNAIASVCGLCGISFYDYAIFSDDGEYFSYFVTDRFDFVSRREGIR